LADVSTDDEDLAAAGTSSAPVLPPALARGRIGSRFLRDGERRVPAWLRQTPGEHRWPAALAVLAAVTLQLFLPQDLAPRPHLLLPGVELLLFLVLAVGNPARMDREWVFLRVTGLGLVAVASVATAWSVVLLVRYLVQPPARVPFPALHLLMWGAAIWVTNVIIFALWFWETDRGGPAARANARHLHPDFLFSQMAVPELIHDDWEPGFVDYLYLSFTNATAFSPTDTLPLSRWAKLTMMAESALSLVTVVLVVARAVNVLH
jgi:hypothetical protein